jgi:hypothetical protein
MDRPADETIGAQDLSDHRNRKAVAPEMNPVGPDRQTDIHAIIDQQPCTELGRKQPEGFGPTKEFTHRKIFFPQLNGPDPARQHLPHNHVKGPAGGLMPVRDEAKIKINPGIHGILL